LETGCTKARREHEQRGQLTSRMQVNKKLMWNRWLFESDKQYYTGACFNNNIRLHIPDPDLPI
jgi:hypothetical protein